MQGHSTRTGFVEQGAKVSEVRFRTAELSSQRATIQCGTRKEPHRPGRIKTGLTVMTQSLEHV
jgi:hypothetical protein